MTSPADTTQHPDVSEISDLTEGLLPPSRGADVRRHLDGCELCADVHASLEEIRGLLGTLPGTARMPVDVAERIDAALAAEALLSSAPPAGGTHVSRETTPPATAMDPGPATRPTGRSRGTTGPGRSSARRGRRRTFVLSSLLAVAAVGVGVLWFQNHNPSIDSTAARDMSAGVKADFAEPDLTAQVQSLLSADQAQPEALGSKDGPFGTESAQGNDEKEAGPRLQKVPQTPPCVQRGTGRTDAPLAVEPGEYAGESAFLVLFPHATDTLKVQAYVVAASCVSSSPDSTGKLLRTGSFSRD